MDDVSSFFLTSGTPGTKVEYNKTEMNAKAGFQKALSDILNRGRHWGTIFLTLHSTNGIDPKVLSTICNVIVGSSSNLGDSRTLFVTQKDYKAKISRIVDDLKIYNQKKGKFYQLVCFRDVD